MTKMLLLAALLLLAAPSIGAAIPCQDAGDVTLLAGGCDAGVLHFDNFLVTVSGPVGVTATVFLTDVVGETLGFTVVTAPLIFDGFLDVAFSYRVLDDPALAATPEPSTLLLLGSSLAGLGYWWRRRAPSG